MEAREASKVAVEEHSAAEAEAKAEAEAEEQSVAGQ